MRGHSWLTPVEVVDDVLQYFTVPPLILEKDKIEHQSIERRIEKDSMARLPKTSNDDVRKGAWGADEDEKLRKYVETYGTGHWRSVGKKAGLQRCGKSCRLRWTNYLRPDIRHGSFTVEEEELIIKLHASHGSRWSLIAAQLPGRTDNDIKNHWNTRLKKKLCDMGIDPVTHQPIADLLRDLAGTIARSGSAGNQDAEEAARRCFRDNMLNKAVRECGRPPAVPSFFPTQSSRNTLQRSGNLAAITVADYHRLDHSTSGTVAARRFEKSAYPANSAHSLEDHSSSTEESLSGRSSSPPLYIGLKHSATIPHRSPFSSLQPDSPAAGHSHPEDAAAAAAATGMPGGREVVYLPSPLPLRLPEGLTTPSNFIQDLAPCPTQSTLQIFPPDSDAFRRSSDSCEHEALRGMMASSSTPPYAPRSEQFGAPSSSEPQARIWFSSRPDTISHDQTQFESENISRFSSTNSINLQQEPGQIHGEGVSYLQESNGLSFRESDKMDHRNGHLIAPIQAAGGQVENMGYRCLNMNLEGVPLSNSSAASDGPAAGPLYHDILQVTNADAAGQFSNSANLTLSSNMITSFVPNSGPLPAGLPRSTPTGLRQHEYEVVIPSPRVALWDY